MAIIDRYLEAMGKQRAEALTFKTGSPVEMTVGGQPRPVSAKPASVEQLQMVLSDAFGADWTSKLAGGQGSFAYKGPHGAFTVNVTARSGDLGIIVVPAAASTVATPSAPAALSTPPPAPTPGIEVGGGSTAGGMPSHIDELFHQMLDMKSSDMHLKSGKVPMVRIDGGMAALPNRPALDAETLFRLVEETMPERNRVEFRETNDTDFAYSLGTRSRMRANVFRDLAGPGAVFRQIPTKILSAKDLNLPPAVLNFCEFDKGLVVVTGPTGSGKSTTLAAMIDHINETRDDHLITIEDPVEFVHRDKKCHINQREISTHTRGFKSALRAALREDPDIVLVGEMRDLETVAIAIETAETGHLVFGTLHTNTAASTVDRLIDQFPTDRQAQVRTMLSESLKGVVAQTLLKKKGGGRVAALEILVVNHAISNLIREGKTFQIPSMMQTGRGIGMQTLNDALLDLVRAGTVEAQEAYDRSINKKELALLLQRNGIKVQETSGTH